jgi:PhzF family phenazine biosynthesis protein
VALSLHMVDVFGNGPFTGNPVAVVSGAYGLSTTEMQQITRWFNLSETTFILPPTDPAADYRVRIFTLDRELPFAGHPTLGTCQVWLNSVGLGHASDEVVQECGAGLVTLWRGVGEGSEDGLAFAAPPLLRYEAPTEAELAEAVDFLGIEASRVVDASWVDNGPGWLALRLGSAEEVLAVESARSWPRRIEVGLVGPHATGGVADFEVRALLTDHYGSVIEDPVTGSLNASLAAWIFDRGYPEPSYVVRQGTKIGRDGRVFARNGSDGRVWIGGNVHIHAAGSFAL